MNSKIKKVEWYALYGFTGLVDIFQILIDLFLTEFVAAPEVVNEFIDVAMGVGLIGYFQLRGVSMVNKPARLFSMLGMEALTDVTGGAASLWILEVWYINKTVKQEEAELAAQKQQESMLQNDIRQPVNNNGVRLPNTQTANSYSQSNNSNTGTNESRGHISTYNAGPLNVDGVRVAVNTKSATSTGTSNSPSSPRPKQSQNTNNILSLK